MEKVNLMAFYPETKSHRQLKDAEREKTEIMSLWRSYLIGYPISSSHP